MDAHSRSSERPQSESVGYDESDDETAALMSFLLRLHRWRARGLAASLSDTDVWRMRETKEKASLSLVAVHHQTAAKEAVTQGPSSNLVSVCAWLDDRPTVSEGAGPISTLLRSTDDGWRAARGRRSQASLGGNGTPPKGKQATSGWRRFGRRDMGLPATRRLAWALAISKGGTSTTTQMLAHQIRSRAIDRTVGGRWMDGWLRRVRLRSR